MAVVYLARALDGRAVAPLVAIKRPHKHLVTDKNFLAMLLDEARLASSIDHPNVVRVRELRFDEGEAAIVMDYVEGASLSELMKELTVVKRAFDPKIALRMVKDSLAGLHAAHELADPSGKPLGIVHRDVSPHNILVGSDGKSRLTDFGIAQAAGRFQSTKTQEVKGKLAYLAPERVDKRRMCTRQSDVFSMGIVLWECIAGRRLFRGEEAVDTLQEVMHLPIPRLRQLGCDISGPLDDAIARSLSRDLEHRYATALEFATALEEASGPTAIAPHEHVARMLEATHGARMTERQAEVAGVLGDEAECRVLFESAGLSFRPGASQHRDDLETLAPPAPSDRYVFGSAVSRLPLRERPGRWVVAAAVAGGIAVGVGGTVALVRGRPVAPVTPPTAAASAAIPPTLAFPPPSTRHVRVHLPFLATRASVDGVARDLAPPSDVLSIDLPLDSPLKHHVLATAFDGSLAEREMVEEDGEVRAVPLPVAPPVAPRSIAPIPVAPVAPPAPATHPSVAPPARPGVLRNGFTKLK
jgi:serine/threonine-protein kinase